MDARGGILWANQIHIIILEVQNIINTISNIYTDFQSQNVNHRNIAHHVDPSLDLTTHGHSKICYLLSTSSYVQLSISTELYRDRTV
jgi:hypothetical protein